MRTPGIENPTDRPTPDLYTSGEFWEDLPDFLVGQAPNKIRHLLKLIDFDSLLAGQPTRTFSIVDIGCGAGKVSVGLAEQLRARYPGVEVTVHGYDLSSQAIAVARRENAEGEFICGDFKDAERTWDLAIVCDVIEHVADPDDFVRCAAQKARYFVTGFAMDYNLANRLLKKRRARVNQVGHISLFNEKRALAVSAKHGTIQNAKYINNPLRRALRITRPFHLLTCPVKILLRMLSRRWKGMVFGGESLFIFARSHSCGGDSSFCGGIGR
jgi:2-polyprenyl-3-methyl-5-hydroxy-6-metoxy-1,4-benzoquinol methylase